MKQAIVTFLITQLAIGWPQNYYLTASGFVETTTTSLQGYRTQTCHTSRRQPSFSPLLLQRQQQKHCAPRYVTVNRPFSPDIEDKHESSVDHRAQYLWVFVHSLQRERRERGLQLQTLRNNHQRSNSPKETAPNKSTGKQYNPAKSLALFLSKNRYSITESHELRQQQQSPEIEPFSRAVIQAIRFSSELGDYKLILHLVEASIHYANENPITPARIFGEAIDNMSKTPANNAKIKQLWNLGTSPVAKSFLKEPLGTYELNIMIKAFASRGKVRAALDLYHGYTQQQPNVAIVSNETAAAVINGNDHPTTTSSHSLQQSTIIPDPYTLSSIFLALQESVTDDQVMKFQDQSHTASGKSEIQYHTAPTSHCWQWNEAMEVLASYKSQNSFPKLNNHVFASLLKLNDRISQVYTLSAHNGPRMALFLLNTMNELNISPDIVTCTLIISNLGYQWKTAVNMLYAMKTAPLVDDDDNVSWRLPRPNVYTYSAVITICAHCHQYQVAMELLQEMKKDQNMDYPNTWVYNAALLATTRSDSLTVLAAESTLQQQEQQLRSTSKPKRSRERLSMAMKLLREMQADAKDKGCKPDTVTYNTVLATLDGVASPVSDEEDDAMTHWFDKQFAVFFHDNNDAPLESNIEQPFEERAVHRLLNEMEESNIMRDSITYRNALLAVRFSHDIRASVWRILDRAVLDKDALRAGNLQQEQGRLAGRAAAKNRTRGLAGKAADGVNFVFDAAMTVLASHGDVEGVLLTSAKMWRESTITKPTNVAGNVRAGQIHFIQALGKARREESEAIKHSSLIPSFLRAIKGDRVAKFEIAKQFPVIDDFLFVDHGENESLFTAAISSCLVANDIDNARKALSMMKEEGLQPSELSLQEIARTYARLAVAAASDEAKGAAQKGQNTDNLGVQSNVAKAERPVDTLLATVSSQVDAASDRNVTGTLAKARARNAFIIATKTLSVPPASLLSTIARSCASVGMWEEAASILRSLHSRIPAGSKDLSTVGLVGSAQTVLPGLHRALLRASSIQGNVTAALWFVDDIQKLSKRIAKSILRQREEEDQLFASSVDKAASYRQDQASLDNSALDSMGMTAEDWRLLIIAAAKCGHWRVCLSTLQFLRPFLEETHPSSLGITVEERSRRYGHIAPALTVALKCLEVRSQYGWAIRAIDDWIEWSGRRPPKAAVLSAVRILSARGRGSEVNRLVTRCTMNDGTLLSYSDDGSYEMALYVGAIVALHHQGLYDDADDAFVAAVNGNYLPFDLSSEEIEGKQRIVLDLHGMNVPVAHAAVRVALQQEVEVASWNRKKTTKPPATDVSSPSDLVWDMVIVTGRGRNSALRMRPVLRPEVQRMLVEEFYPPLSTTSIPGNMGAVRVPASDISAWLSHQRRQKGSRMLAVASVLRNVSSIDRLRQSIARKIEAEEKRVSTTSEGEEKPQ